MIRLMDLLDEDLRKWFGKGKWGGAGGGGWDRYNSSGERIGKCGAGKEGEAYAACLSKHAAKKLGKKGRASFVRRKRAKQNDKNRGDILFKCDASHHARIRKLSEVNSKLFVNFEAMNTAQRTGIPDSMQDGFIMESEEGDENDELNENTILQEDTAASPQKPFSSAAIREDDSFDIDAI